MTQHRLGAVGAGGSSGDPGPANVAHRSHAEVSGGDQAEELADAGLRAPQLASLPVETVLRLLFYRGRNGTNEGSSDSREHCLSGSFFHQGGLQQRRGAHRNQSVRRLGELPDLL